ncbi:Crp/Fnr family transcriptional regulator [Abyssibius alkaniclasticus]|uniref:transcriptional regulator FnrL n=1 Tax=Abyssibius alkaniclasticus TaxID=2881234 RepID=UPI0023635CB5|nr:Crp/Fnr family transcriptional regulator [Abyssibius alkaniclasticus]UPH72697.1 Crp/Fnr family transcriptional regulator [Abyssibius alkaniclasticus]|tara:strand:+ start:1265 stop:2014 length:750 start_codon:yes stop_codon:yes gene_type:complete
MPSPQPKIDMNLRCGDCPIRHQAVCAYSQPDELVKLDAIKSYKTYKAGETLFWAGEEMASIGSVVNGVATLGRSLPDGRRQMVGLLLPSDFIGRPGRKIAPFDVVAASDVLVCTFQKKQFDAMIANSPSLERRLLDMTLDELDSAREWMLLLGRKTAREKIASLLAIVARRDAALAKRAPKDGLVFNLPLTREAMADYLGLTIETVSRQMTALRRDGLIELEEARRIRVPDYAALLNEAGDDSDGGMLE